MKYTFENKGKWSQQIAESAQKNEAVSPAKLKQRFKDISLYKEWDIFDNIAYELDSTSDEKGLEKAILATGMAKIIKVKDIKNPNELTYFNSKYFKPDDKLVLFRKQNSNKYYGESAQVNEDIFKPTISERDLLRKVDDTIKWLTAVLKDQKRKLEPKWADYWDPEDIQDTIDEVEQAIKIMQSIKYDLTS